MRKQLFKNIEAQMSVDEGIIFLAGDVGYSLIEDIQEKFHQRVINFGIAEQSMMGVGAGLAISGKKVLVYTIGNFNTFRCAEQIRNDIAYHNLDLTIVVVGGGVSYGNMGYTHHAIQDYALLQSFPNIEILSPYDEYEMNQVCKRIWRERTPKYLRIGRGQERPSSNVLETIVLGPGEQDTIINLRSGNGNSKASIIATGETQVQVGHLLDSEIYDDFDFYTIPKWSIEDSQNIGAYFRKYNEVQTVENHLAFGGFGHYIRNALSRAKASTLLRINCLSNDIIGKVGAEDYLTKLYTITT